MAILFFKKNTPPMNMKLNAGLTEVKFNFKGGLKDNNNIIFLRGEEGSPRISFS